jgi:pimeloyl-ACP methyl ester carboxylesterase
MLKEATFKGIKIRYNYRKKNKRTVVLLHGFLEDHQIWSTYQKELAKNSTVISIDLPGHGSTPCLGYVHSMEEMAEVVKSVLDTENIRKAILVGHSMGGYVALAFGELFPDNINGICLFNSTAQPDTESKKSERDRAIQVVKKNHERFIQEAIPNLFKETGFSKSSPKVRSLIQKAIKTPKQGIVAALEGMKIRVNREIILKFAPYPIFFVIGKKDPIIPFEHLIEQANQSENAQYYLSEKGGHMCFIEDTYPCLSALQKFIVHCKKAM